MGGERREATEGRPPTAPLISVNVGVSVSGFLVSFRVAHRATNRSCLFESVRQDFYGTVKLALETVMAGFGAQKSRIR